MQQLTKRMAAGVVATMAVLLVVPTLSRADDSKTLSTLKAEKAALAERLKQVEVDIDRIQIGQGVDWLGMTIVNPTEDLMREYGLMEKYIGPIIVKVRDGSFFPERTVPTEGCSFWIVEHPAKAFFLNTDKSPSHYPRNVRDLAEAIVACTLSPTEYQALHDKTAKAAREYAETQKDDPAKHERWLKISAATIDEADVGKYVCRVVYNYPNTKENGTMTTYLRMTEADLDKFREFLKK